MAEGDVAHDGRRLIDQLVGATTTVMRLKNGLNRVALSAVNAKIALGKWPLPDDASVGEKIAVWDGDSLYQAEKTIDGPVVTIRTRGKQR